MGPSGESIVSLTSLGGPRGDSFLATGSSGRSYTLVLSSSHRARPDRGAVAYHRLARALGLDSVSPSAGRRVPLYTLSQWPGADPPTSEALRQKALVANDGTVRVLLQQRCAGRAVNAHDSPEVKRWAELASSTASLDPASASLVRGYVEMVVLDYLAGNVARRTLELDETANRICLLDQQDAFPGFLAPKAWDVLLARVRPIVRFPRALGPALERFDRSRAEAELRPGRFDDWLVGPRDIADLLDRRAALLTLVQARAEQYGADVAASLGP
jgi:hypothetical protein